MITDCRKKHIWAVAQLMLEYGKQRGKSKQDCEALYTLGLLHDIGYAFLEEKEYKTHNIVGGNLLKQQGYQYWQEVYYHGVVNSPYQSEFLDLLNVADMHVDSEGNYVTFQERLQDISTRQNMPVEQLDGYQIVCELIKKGFN